MRWYAIYTRSNYERRVSDELDRKGIQTYLPAFQEVRHWTDRDKVIEVPLFRSYVFVRFVDEPGIRRSVLQSHGVVRIVGFGDSIEPIPDEEVDALKQVLAVSLGKCLVHPLIREGSRIRVKRGPLKNLEGLLLRFKSQTRLIISINLLSQSVSAEVEAADLEFLESTPRLKRPVGQCGEIRQNCTMF